MLSSSASVLCLPFCRPDDLVLASVCARLSLLPLFSLDLVLLCSPLGPCDPYRLILFSIITDRSPFFSSFRYHSPPLPPPVGRFVREHVRTIRAPSSYCVDGLLYYSRMLQGVGSTSWPGGIPTAPFTHAVLLFRMCPFQWSLRNLRTSRSTLTLPDTIAKLAVLSADRTRPRRRHACGPVYARYM